MEAWFTEEDAADWCGYMLESPPILCDFGQTNERMNVSKPQLLISTTGIMIEPALLFCDEDREVLHGRCLARCLAHATDMPSV